MTALDELEGGLMAGDGLLEEGRLGFCLGLRGKAGLPVTATGGVAVVY